jgi:diguanylate cyclase (GGDEF)-like protein
VSQRTIVFKWTIARKIGGLTTILIFFNLIIIIYSIISLKKIREELHEIVSLDIPLTELCNSIENHRFQQDILFYQFLQLSQRNNKRVSTSNKITIKQLLSTKQTQVDKYLDRGIKLSQRGFTTTSEKLFKEINQILLAFQKETDSFNSQLAILIKELESGKNLTQPTVEQIFKQEEYLEIQGITLADILERLTERKFTLIQKHQTIFLIVNTALGIVAILLGGLLTSIIIIGIKTNIFRLSQKVSDVTQAIEEHNILPSGYIEIKSSDEFVDLAQKLMKMIDSVSLTIEQQKQLEKHLKALAISDTLTGAFNRRKWEENLTLEIARTRRTGQELSIIIFDIDFFKKINDNYGHDVGDRVLVEIVKIVKTQIRKIDSLYRIGGEEFAILAPATNREQVVKLAQRVRQSVESHPFDPINQVTISLGATQFKESDDREQFIKRADIALYKSKRKGRNQVQFE